MTRGVRGEVVTPGVAQGALLRLEAPISLWGGVDPASGRIVQTGHPQAGELIGARVLAADRLIGSSSGSSVLLELIAAAIGPAALILGEIDAIAVLGVLVAAELGYPTPPVLRLDPAHISRLPDWCRIDAEGWVSGV